MMSPTVKAAVWTRYSPMTLVMSPARGVSVSGFLAATGLDW
jgi:hypothetical protein